VSAVPRSGFVSPHRTRMRVVLPAPFAPSSAQISHDAIAKPTPSRAVFSPKRTTASRTGTLCVPSSTSKQRLVARVPPGAPETRPSEEIELRRR
jgi:hypothetical protein